MVFCCVTCCSSVEYPLLNAVRDRARKLYEVPLHVPGHKRGHGVAQNFKDLAGRLVVQSDLTELHGLDNLANPTGVIRQSQELAATLFGAQRTWFVVNGCSGAVHAAIMATCDEESVIIMARNCHTSAWSALILTGASPQYLIPEIDESNEVAHAVTVESVRRELQKARLRGSRVGAVFIVSPTYFGAVADVAGIARECHAFNVPLIVDEAHGSHFSFHDSLPRSAISCGADLVAQSTHKTLSSLTQSAMLHLNSDLIKVSRITQSLRVLQTSSPSYLLLASLDAARGQCADPQFLEEAIEAAQFTSKSLDQIPGVNLLHLDPAARSMCHEFDPLKVCIQIKEPTISGHVLGRDMEQLYGIVPEMSLDKMVLCYYGPGSRMEDAKALSKAVQDYIKQKSISKNEPVPTVSSSDMRVSSIWAGFQPQVLETPRNAFFSQSKSVILEESTDLVSAEVICPYPPGIPLVNPGECLSQPIVDALVDLRAQDVVTVGHEDPNLEKIQVI